MRLLNYKAANLQSKINIVFIHVIGGYATKEIFLVADSQISFAHKFAT